MFDSKLKKELLFKVLISIAFEDSIVNTQEENVIKKIIIDLFSQNEKVKNSIPDMGKAVEKVYKKYRDEYLSYPGEDIDAKQHRWTWNKLIEIRKQFDNFNDDEKAIILEWAYRLIKIDKNISDKESTIYHSLMRKVKESPHGKKRLPLLKILKGYKYIVEEQKSATVQDPHLPHTDPFYDDIEVEFDDDASRRETQARAEIKKIDAALGVLKKATHDAGILARYMDPSKLIAAEKEGMYGNFYFLQPKPAGRVEYIVIGDIHGSYTCMKAILQQSGFIEKVRKYREDGVSNPDIKLLFLGDYVDRGSKGYDGVVRTLVKLMAEYPGHVIPLCGNHEAYYLDEKGEVQSSVEPADTLEFWKQHLPQDLIKKYHDLFRSLPGAAFLDGIIFTHAGITRGIDFDWLRSLGDLNNDERRAEMYWSDPHLQADYIEREMQVDQGSRFNFGTEQFHEFMEKINCKVLVRGHEQINEGFMRLLKERGMQLYSLFSVGGKDNIDLPESAFAYTRVAPKYLSLVKEVNDAYILTPHDVRYEAYNRRENNKFIVTE